MTINIRQDQLDEITRLYFFRKLRNFLFEHSRHEAMRQKLLDHQSWTILWGRLWEDVKEFNERKIGIIFSFALACQCEGLSPDEMLTHAFDQSDAEIFMKNFLADHEYLRFSEFFFETQAN